MQAQHLPPEPHPATESAPPSTDAAAPEAPEPEPEPLPPLELVRCDPSWFEQVPALVALELSALSAERTALTRGKVHHLRVECGAGQVAVEAMLVSGRGAQTVVRLMGLGPEAQVRSVALSAVELVDTLWQQELDPDPAPPPAPPPRPAPSRGRAPRSPAVFLQGAAQAAGRPTVWFGGASVVGELPLARHFTAMGDASLVVGGRTTAEARVTALSGSASIAILVEARTRALRFGVGPAGRLGWFRMRGNPHEESGLTGEVADGPWGGPALAARLALAPRGSSWRVAVGAEAGIVTLPVTGTRDQGEAIQELSGAWLGLGFGVGVSP